MDQEDGLDISGLTLDPTPAIAPALRVRYAGLFLDGMTGQKIDRAFPQRHTCRTPDWHVTLAFDPSPSELQQSIMPHVGTECSLRVDGEAHDHCGQALSVTLLDAQVNALLTPGRQAHVTLSTAEGVEASYSNTLLKHCSDDGMVPPTSPPLIVQGSIGLAIEEVRDDGGAQSKATRRVVTDPIEVSRLLKLPVRRHPVAASTSPEAPAAPAPSEEVTPVHLFGRLPIEQPATPEAHGAHGADSWECRTVDDALIRIGLISNGDDQGGSGRAPTVVVMRGLPGSGKSSLVQAIAQAAPAAMIASADDWFSNGADIRPQTLRQAGLRTREEVYRFCFDAKKLSKAHGYCRQVFDYALARKIPWIIVDNTNSTRSEYAYYWHTAVRAGYQAKVLEVRCASLEQVRRCHARCSHGVPWHVYESMLNRWEADLEAVVIGSLGHEDDVVGHARSTQSVAGQQAVAAQTWTVGRGDGVSTLVTRQRGGRGGRGMGRGRPPGGRSLQWRQSRSDALYSEEARLRRAQNPADNRASQVQNWNPSRSE